MPRSSLLKTTGARLTLIYAGLLVGAFAVIGVLTSVVSRSAAENQLRDRITLEVEALTTEAEIEGVDAVVEAIRARAQQPGSLEYAFTDSAGDLLDGGSRISPSVDGWSDTDATADDADEPGDEELLVLTTTLAGGQRLAVGAELTQMERTRDRILQSLFAIGGVTALIGLAIGWLATRNALGRMAGFNAALRRVEDGDLSSRVPIRSKRREDDIDALGNSINTMLARIAQLVASVRRVSTEIAHDLRTPLTHLQQKLERAHAADNDTDRLAEIESAQAKVTEVMRTFDAMLRLAEIESGTARSRFTIVDLDALIERVADAYRPDVEASGRSLHLGRLDRIHVLGDADLLTQAVSNLIENGIRHTRAGSTITIEALQLAGRFELTVRDDGTGVSAADRDRILAPFVRVDSARSTSGAGLGLSIVAAIAQLHGADIALRDAHPGLEVTITFTTSDKADA